MRFAYSSTKLFFMSRIRIISFLFFTALHSAQSPNFLFCIYIRINFTVMRFSQPLYLLMLLILSSSLALHHCPSSANLQAYPSHPLIFFSALLSHNNNKAMAVVSRVSNYAMINPVVKLMADVMKKEDERHILQIDLSRMEILLENIGVFQNQQAPPEMVKIWLQLLQNCLRQAERLLDRSGRRQRCFDCVVCVPRRLSKQATQWNALFDHLYHGFQIDSELPLFVTSLQFLSSKPLYKEAALLQGVGASGFVGSGITDAQSLSEDEAWMLFRRVAFKDSQVSMDIEKRGRRFAEECKGVPLAINIVAAMLWQIGVNEWDTCLSLKRNVDPSFPGGLDAQLYTLLRWSYDTLPNSTVKNCFLYCSLYQENEEIDSRRLVEMWVGEGLVKSKEGTHIMDMAIGRHYLKLLLDRCFFHIVKESSNVFRYNYFSFDERRHDVFPSIRVEPVIREMALYIAHKEENCLFNLPNFPEEAHYENCRRLSFPHNYNYNYSGDLLTHLRCPNLKTLIFEGNSHLKELPSEFVVGLTSLRVLNLSACTQLTSVPTSVGQLTLLEFLSLSGLPIQQLPEEVCHLSKLQFLDLSLCRGLKSLPSQIGELKNLKHPNLVGCGSLEMIPREISQLTSLSRLQLGHSGLSVEKEAPASIWSLKGLQNLTELQVKFRWGQHGKDGIMGSWSEMRHLALEHANEIPEDMQKMKKLQSFMRSWYEGSRTLPNYKFEHLEMVKLYACHGIRELSPLERLPNLKLFKLEWCLKLRALGIGSPSAGYGRLHKLVLKGLGSLKSFGGGGSWDERTVGEC